MRLPSLLQTDSRYSMIVSFFLFFKETQKIIADMSFCSKIKQIKIRLNKIVVALYNKVFLIDLFKF